MIKFGSCRSASSVSADSCVQSIQRRVAVAMLHSCKPQLIAQALTLLKQTDFNYTDDQVCIFDPPSLLALRCYFLLVPAARPCQQIVSAFGTGSESVILVCTMTGVPDERFD